MNPSTVARFRPARVSSGSSYLPDGVDARSRFAFRNHENGITAFGYTAAQSARGGHQTKARALTSWLRHLRESFAVERNFRFRRHEIRERLFRTRRALPRALHIEGTNVCNANCVFCAYSEMQRPKQVMPMPLFRKVVDDYVAMDGHYVSLTPIVGDPFVDPLLYERLDDLHRRPEIYHYYFYTNGILMTPADGERLFAYAPKFAVHVSWGGFDRDEFKTIMGVDRFDAVRSNVDALIARKRATGSALGIVIELRCPPASCRGEFWERLCDARREGLISIETETGYDSWAGQIDAADIAAVGLEPRRMPHKRGPCELLFMKPVVLVDGRVNACACRDVEGELIVGDVKASPLTEIWHGATMDGLIEAHERGEYPSVCRRCTYYTSVYRPGAEVFEGGFNWSG